MWKPEHRRALAWRRDHHSQSGKAARSRNYSETTQGRDCPDRRRRERAPRLEGCGRREGKRMSGRWMAEISTTTLSRWMSSPSRTYGDLHAIVERGPNLNTIERIVVT
jgi:hypothetical protein